MSSLPKKGLFTGADGKSLAATFFLVAIPLLVGTKLLLARRDARRQAQA